MVKGPSIDTLWLGNKNKSFFIGNFSFYYNKNVFAVDAFIGNWTHVNSMGYSSSCLVYLLNPTTKKYYAAPIMVDFTILGVKLMTHANLKKAIGIK